MSEIPDKLRILIVEDEGIISKDIERALTQMNYDVCARVMTGLDAVAKAREHKPDLVLMDIVLKGGMDGIETADMIRHELNIPVIYLTAYTDQEKIDRARETEAFAYIVKPFEDRELHSNIQLAMYKHAMEKQLRHALEECRRLINVCWQREARIKELREEVERQKAVIASLRRQQ